MTWRLRVAIVIGLIGGVAAGTAVAQMPPRQEPDAQRAAMKRLDSMAGNWQGEGWMLFGDRRAEFKGGERVARKLDGLALLVEGAFTARPPGSDRDIPVHTTLGVISYDPDAKAYRFHTWLATGGSGVRELHVTEQGWQWDITSPQGTIRYVTTLTEGEWHEVGDRSRDGKTWQRFFEMRLKRVAD